MRPTHSSRPTPHTQPQREQQEKAAKERRKRTRQGARAAAADSDDEEEDGEGEEEDDDDDDTSEAGGGARQGKRKKRSNCKREWVHCACLPACLSNHPCMSMPCRWMALAPPFLPPTTSFFIFQPNHPHRPLVEEYVVPVVKRRAARSKQQRAEDRRSREEQNDEAFDRVVAHLVRHHRPLSE